jgi:hypothetical protein
MSGGVTAMKNPRDGYGAGYGKGPDPRGALLLHDAAGWRRQHRIWGLWSMARVYMVFSMGILIIYFLYVREGMQYMDEGMTFRERAEGFGQTVVLVLTFMALALVPYYIFLTWGPAPAIFTGGVQLRKGKFVPFTSVCATHVFTKGMLFKTRELLLEPVLREDWHGGNPLKVWVIPMMIIGEDGKDLIESKVREVIIPPEPDMEPPPLKIFGPKNVRGTGRS